MNLSAKCQGYGEIMLGYQPMHSLQILLNLWWKLLTMSLNRTVYIGLQQAKTHDSLRILCIGNIHCDDFTNWSHWLDEEVSLVDTLIRLIITSLFLVIVLVIFMPNIILFFPPLL